MNIFNKKPFLIGDIGVNIDIIAKREEMSYVEVVKFMIDEAKSCGIDAVNVQSYAFKNIFSFKNPLDSDLFIEFEEFTFDDYNQIAEFCQSIGVMLILTPFDFESVDYLDEFVDVYEIHSGDLTNIPFIKYIASKNKPILLSTGAATLREIKNAIGAIEEVSVVDIALMHTVLSYPTEYRDANLLMIKDLDLNFPDYEIGYIDNTKPDKDMMVLTTAFNYGAVILQKPFTLDKSLNDCDYAMDADDVISFKKNSYFLSKINGYTNKQPLICESSLRNQSRKSIVSNCNIKKGETISMSNIAFKRPGNGISPKDVDDVLGKTAAIDISENTLIDLKMLK